MTSRTIHTDDAWEQPRIEKFHENTKTIWVVFNNIKRTKPHLAFAFYSVTAVIKMRKKNGDIENKQTKNPCDL